jgi:hypothetical protein
VIGCELLSLSVQITDAESASRRRLVHGPEHAIGVDREA